MTTRDRGTTHGNSSTPSRWLEENLDLLPPRGRVLDVAAGRGRNALFLARRGYAAVLVDWNLDSLREALRVSRVEGLELSACCADLGRGLPVSGPFDVVLCFNYLQRDLFPSMAGVLAPGGWLVVETFTRGQVRLGRRPRNPAFLLDEGELSSMVWPVPEDRPFRMQAVRVREGIVGDGDARAGLVVRAVSTEEAT